MLYGTEIFLPLPNPITKLPPIENAWRKKKKKENTGQKKKNTMINAERHESEQLIEAKVNRPIWPLVD